MKNKKYIVIGHWKESKNMTCISPIGSSVKEVRADLSGNAFVPYVIITGTRFNKLKNMDSLDIYEEVKKMTTNYRVWDYVTDYILQCFDIIEGKMSRA